MNDAEPGSDPFQLERLAEELATRELTHDDDDDDELSHDLPVFIPLSHSNPYLTADTFDIEQFLLSRSHTSLQDLRSELRDYLSTLKEELVKLINDDYEAFISLSTDLRGEGVRLGKLKAPLSGLRTEILASKSELQLTQAAIQHKLETRAVLREEKALLHLLLKISESVTRLEGLLLIASPSNDDTEPINGPSLLSTPSTDSQEDKARGNQAKHLSRVAAEYTQLLYHAAKARNDNCAFVDEMQWRIDRIQSTLSSDLDHHFSTLLQALTEGKGDRKTLDAKDKLPIDLTECMHTYDMLGLWRDAEDIIRRDIVRRFVKKTIYSGALNAPQSPLVPHTPFNPTSAGFSASLHPPKTPYTPFTAFPLKQFSLPSAGKRHSPYMSVLEESDEPIAKLYCQILRFVERDLCRIMDIAEKVSIKSLPGGHGKGFEIMANVVWDEFARAIMDELGSVVFSVGKPNVFRKNYDITQTFIRSLEYLAPGHSVESMRTHPTFNAFERRWQLPVYFQMRWKEIVSRLEDVLSVPKVEAKLRGSDAFATTQADAVWIAITACWSSEIFIPELSHRFWRLTLQLISRFKTWLTDSLSTLERKHIAPHSGVPLRSSTPAPRSSTPVPRSATPVPQPEAAAESVATDDAHLMHYTAAILDVNMMQKSIIELWNEQISRMLPRVETVDSDVSDYEVVLRRSLSSLSSLIPSIDKWMVSILSRRCSDALHNLRGIPTQFRGERDKRPLTKPSKFVADLLGPVKSFFSGNGTGASLPSELRRSITERVFVTVLQRYLANLVELKKIEDALRRLKKNKKPTFSLFGNANAGKDDEDDERIKTQIKLDVDVFGKDAVALGISVQEDESFRALCDLADNFDHLETT
ncbi:oligomeric golgi complex component, COG2-domain-containing protein [Mucidula mucida]|nr:oligomeric golgi complex component, COG2-domain-containing protein [Mucidula mucida]